MALQSTAPPVRLEKLMEQERLVFGMRKAVAVDWTRVRLAAWSTKALVISPNTIMETGKADPWMTADTAPRNMRNQSKPVAKRN